MSVAKKLQSRAADAHRTARHTADCSAYAKQEATRDVVRGRMSELARRVREPSYPGRALDLAELDRLWLEVTRW